MVPGFLETALLHCFISSSLPPSGTAAMRNTRRGSWFIQELNTALRLHARDRHLADILVQVKIKPLVRTAFCVNVLVVASVRL